MQEVVGIFFNADSIRSALAELVGAGFDHTEIGLVGGEDTVERSLGGFYARAAEIEQTPDSPSVAFVTKQDGDDTFHGLVGGLFFCGATTLAGAIVASAAVVGGAALAAVGGVAAVGVAGAAAGLAIRQTDAERLKEQLDEGHLLLFVRTRSAQRAEVAVDILARHGAQDAEVVQLDEATEEP